MKLYIKANSIKILKNLKALMSPSHAKTAYFLAPNAPQPYHINLQSATTLHTQRQTLFFSDKPLWQLLKGVYFGNSACEHLLPSIADIVEAQRFCQKEHLNFVCVLSSFPR